MSKKNRFRATEVIAALVKTRGMITIAADLLQCDDTTVRNYMKRYKTVRDVVEHYNEKMVDVAELKFWAAIEAGEPWAVAMALKTKGKNRGYVERTEAASVGETVIRVIRDDKNHRPASTGTSPDADENKADSEKV